MNSNVLERLNEINKELEKLEREENNMNKNDFVQDLIDKYATMTKEQEEIFEMYKTLVKRGSTFKDLFEDTFRMFGKDGIVEIGKVIAMGYVNDIHYKNELDLTDNELDILVKIHLGLDMNKEDEKELDNILFAICNTALHIREEGNR